MQPVHLMNPAPQAGVNVARLEVAEPWRKLRWPPYVMAGRSTQRRKQCFSREVGETEAMAIKIGSALHPSVELLKDSVEAPIFVREVLTVQAIECSQPGAQDRKTGVVLPLKPSPLSAEVDAHVRWASPGSRRVATPEKRVRGR